jgi:DNA-binding NarL/FixJ family response regulator
MQAMALPRALLHPPAPLKKLLLVEHSPSQLARLLGLLRAVDGPLTLLTARSLEQAFQTLASEQPALVVVDLHMPDGNALQSVAHMKRLVPGLQVAALAFEPSSFDRAWCLEAGVDFVLDKASESGDLTAIVRRAARGG